MRILFVGERLGVGGPGRVISLLASEMARLGHQVGIVNMRPEPQVYPVEPGIVVMDIRARHEDRLRVVPERFFGLTRALRRFRPDHVFSFCTEINSYTLWAALGRRCPVTVSERSDPRLRPVLRSARILRDITYRLLGRSFVFQTEEARDHFPERIRRLSAVIENPLNDGALPSAWDGERTGEIVTAARLVSQKNLPMLIDAFAIVHEKHPQTRLVLYGEGPKRRMLQKMIDAKGLSREVLMPGFAKDLYERIRKAAVYVSTSDFEGISNSMLEAMALGLPSVVTDCPVGGARRMILSGVNGLLVPVGDASACAEAINRLIEQPELARSLGREAVKIRERLNLTRIAEQWLQQAETCAKPAKRRASKAPQALPGNGARD